MSSSSRLACLSCAARVSAPPEPTLLPPTGRSEPAAVCIARSCACSSGVSEPSHSKTLALPHGIASGQFTGAASGWLVEPAPSGWQVDWLNAASGRLASRGVRLAGLNAIFLLAGHLDADAPGAGVKGHH